MPPRSEGPTGTASAGAGATVPRIPDHVLLRKIAEGSYGEIWLARCALGHYRAVKIVHRSRFQDSRPYEREYSGIQNFEPVSREHEGFVDILQVGRNDEAGFFYYIMELADDARPKQNAGATESGCDGKSANGLGASRRSGSGLPSDCGPRTSDSYVPHTLAREISTRGALPVDEVLAISSALAEGLKFLHGKGLVHRDIKPSNIIFVGGKPRLADVGLVAELDATRSLVGTLGYFPSEGPGTPQADIYSLGKVIYEAATGRDRQEFPQPPVNLGEGKEGSRMIELNEVILRACARKPEDRYQTADAMLRDLNRLRQGDSLVKARARRRVLRRAGAVAAVILGIAAVTGLALYLNQDKVLFSDTFDSAQIDTNKWIVSTNWPESHPAKRRASRAFQTNGGLVLEASAEQTNGYSTVAGAWLDSRTDFRKYGDCRVKVEMAGTNWNGHTIISISDGTLPRDPEDSRSTELLTMPDRKESVPNLAVPLSHTRVGIHLLPEHQAAVIYPDAAIPDVYEIADLGALKEWHLRICSIAASSSGADTSLAHLRIEKVSATTAPASEMVVGFVEQAPAGTALPGAYVCDANGHRLAKSQASGAFRFTATEWPVTIRVHHEEFWPSAETEISGDPRRRHLVTVGLRKRQPAFGDVVEVIPVTNAQYSIGFLGTNLWTLVNEWNTTKVEALLKPIYLQGKETSPPFSQFTIEEPGLASFTQCGDRILATVVHPGRIYELDLESSRHPLKIEPRAFDGRFIDWPWACAFDGKFLWILEGHVFETNWGLHALDPQTLEAKHWLRSDDQGIRGLAWDQDQKQFWVSSSSGGGRVFAVNREIAMRKGRMEPAMMRTFAGEYASLAHGAGHLWGFDSKRKQICKIKVAD